jgi:arginine metabolism regulation protein II
MRHRRHDLSHIVLADVSQCRTRHVKCDEGRPRYSSCVYSGLLCGGYEKSVFFNSGDTIDKGIARFRRPLLTLKERERMVEYLTSSVAPATARRLLSQIDDECDNATNLNDFQVDRGPFGAFRLSQKQ